MFGKPPAARKKVKPVVSAPGTVVPPRGAKADVARKPPAGAKAVVDRLQRVAPPPVNPGARGNVIDGRGAGSDAPDSERIRQCKVDAARAVGYRESLLIQVNAVVAHWPQERDTATEAVRLLANLSKELREAGLQCVEKVVAWVLCVSDPALGPKPFLWNGSDYMLKMFTDLDFVVTELGKKAWKVGNFCRGNPLLLSKVWRAAAYLAYRNVMC